MSTVEIPVRHLFTLTLSGLNKDRYDYVGPFGRRVFEKASGGSLVGERVKGKVLELLATDYGNASSDGRLRNLDAYFTAQTHDGTIILMQVRGRMSPAYGAGQSRVQIIFTVETGAYDWLNHLVAVGIGHEEGDDTVMEIYALTGAQELETPSPYASASERTSLPAEYVLSRKSKHTPGAERHVIDNPISKRFLTLAESGGAFEGVNVKGQFLPGYSWSPHRMTTVDGNPLLHYDVKTLLRSDDGVPILMSYVGTYAPTVYPNGSWVTAVLFEVPEGGPYAGLNEIQAIGVGRWAGDGAHYMIYAMK